MGGSWLWGRHGLASAPTKPMIATSPCDEDTTQACWESFTFQPRLNSLVIWWRQSGIIEATVFVISRFWNYQYAVLFCFCFKKWQRAHANSTSKEFYSNERSLRLVYRWKCTDSSSSLTCYHQKMTYRAWVQPRQQCEHLPKPSYSTLNTCRTILQHRKMFFSDEIPFTLRFHQWFHPVAMFLF